MTHDHDTMAANVERKKVDTSSIKGKPIIWIMGGPGSGKGTQCERITMKFGYTHISSGDLLRAEVMSGTKRGSQLYKLMASGESVPNEIVDDILAEAMVRKADSTGFLVDGFPIDLEQAEAFNRDIGTPATVIFLEAVDQVLKQRLLSRNNFDDTEDSITKRIENFNNKTRPILAKFNAKFVNAERSAVDIFADVEKIIAEVK
jgi:adenylate kinase